MASVRVNISKWLDSTAVGNMSSYHVEKLMGKGQFSAVYKATHKPTGKAVALKAVEIFAIEDPKAQWSCLREAFLLKGLRHPRIIQGLASFMEANSLCIVLELAEAGDLSRMIKYFRENGRIIPEKTLWKYYMQVCEAVAYVHGMKIIHRDIKPANIFITAEGDVKLGDFGLGRYLGSHGALDFTLVGTPYYMAPERIMELPYDCPADVWSLGCVLHEMAALRPPFYSDEISLSELCECIIQGHCPPLGPPWSKQLRFLISHCLQHDPGQRPTAQQLVEFSQSMYTMFV